MSQLEHFDRLAGRYERLRGADDPAGLARFLEVVLRAAGVERGTRVLDIGCGTGRTAAFAASQGAEVVGLDPSPGMRAEARAKGVEAYEGTAEMLPFGDETFDVALMQLVVHHVDRPHAFTETVRILARGGRLAIVTTNPSMFDRAWLAPFFPSYVAIERKRFPEPEQLERELLAAGFAHADTTLHEEPRRFSRDTAIDKIRGRYGSTFELLPPGEYEAGLEQAARELPDPVEYVLHFAITVATR